ncbi:hypothetical protein [Streptomyces sp. IBSBF 2394]|uniref:hypothetical protein n=1 Tax=Streptomyces sp. IBSBF 2394 TaxID=2903532 RepID=UPI002FDC64DB
MRSYAKDLRCIAMAEALIPLLRRACPDGAGGYGGYYQVNLDDEEAVGLGGVELIRAAMRKAAKQLGWTGSAAPRCPRADRPCPAAGNLTRSTRTAAHRDPCRSAQRLGTGTTTSSPRP